MNNSRYLRILLAAADLAKRDGLPALTRQAIADEADVAPSLVSHYFDTMPALVDTLMDAAIESRDVPLVTCGLVVKHPKALAAPDSLWSDAVEYFTQQVGGNRNGSTKTV